MLISADCVSLTMRNSPLPFIDGGCRDTQAVCRLLLSEPLLAALFAYYLIYAHGITSLTGYHGPRLTATAPRSSSLPKT